MAQTFKDIWVSLDADGKRELAEQTNTSVNYLSQVAHGTKRPNLETVAKIVAGNSQLTVNMIRPDVSWLKNHFA